MGTLDRDTLKKAIKVLFDLKTIMRSGNTPLAKRIEVECEKLILEVWTEWSKQ